MSYNDEFCDKSYTTNEPYENEADREIERPRFTRYHLTCPTKKYSGFITLLSSPINNFCPKCYRSKGYSYKKCNFTLKVLQ